MQIPSRAGIRPVVLGCFAIYTPHMLLARQVYGHLGQHPPAGRCGTLVLETGEAVYWINLRWAAMNGTGTR